MTHCINLKGYYYLIFIFLIGLNKNHKINRSSSAQVINKLTQNVYNSVSRMMITETDKKVYSILLSIEVNKFKF